MRRQTIRTITLIILISMVLSTVSFAAVTSSAYIGATGAYITRSGDDVNVYFTIVGRGIMTEIGASKIYLYEQNGNAWSKVYTFDSSDPNYTSDMLSYNAGAKGSHVTYPGDSSKNYYATVYFYAANANGSDTIPQNAYE